MALLGVILFVLGQELLDEFQEAVDARGSPGFSQEKGMVVGFDTVPHVTKHMIRNLPVPQPGCQVGELRCQHCGNVLPLDAFKHPVGLELKQTDLVQNTAVGMGHGLDGFGVVVKGLDNPAPPVEGHLVHKLSVVSVPGVGHPLLNHATVVAMGLSGISAGSVVHVPDGVFE